MCLSDISIGDACDVVPIPLILISHSGRSRTVHLFLSERGSPLSADMVNRIVERAGDAVSLGHFHPHMLRRSAGHMLANLGTDTRAIQDYLGYRNIQHTARYTELSQQRLAHVRVR